MHRKTHWRLTIIATGLLCFVKHSEATTITSTSYSAWTAGLTGAPTELDFSPIVIGKSYSTAAGITLKAIGNSSVGFTFTGPDNGSYKLTGYSYGSHNFQSLESGNDSTASMNIATPTSGENALFLAVATTSNTPVLLTLSDGESFTITTQAGSPSNFGLSISHPVTWLTLTTSSGSSVIITDFYYGVSSETQDSPASEGATMAMCGGGLLILFGSVRRKTSGRNT
ncbi:MAG: hypothetical protein JOY62_07245 [Acidobacteriaceae bacterium]|nr:hypothetical protein [Acidobacteriaceae bacterium]MBV9779753.1 hypothetical protein [Acidobacteriaceae bacterium]